MVYRTHTERLSSSGRVRLRPSERGGTSIEVLGRVGDPFVHDPRPVAEVHEELARQGLDVAVGEA